MGMFWHWQLQIDGETYDVRVRRSSRITWIALLNGENIGKIRSDRVWRQGLPVTVFKIDTMPEEGLRHDVLKNRNQAVAQLVANALNRHGKKTLTLNDIVEAMIINMSEKIEEEQARKQMMEPHRTGHERRLSNDSV